MFAHIMRVYDIHVLLILIELLILVFVANTVFWLRRERKVRRQAKTGEAIYEEIIRTGAKQSHSLFRLQDGYPLFVMDNLEQVIGITAEQFARNRGELLAVLGRSSAKTLQEQYDAWDGKGILHIEFICANNGRWIRLEIQRVLDGAYELVVFDDIHEEKESRLELEQQLKRAEDANVSKSQFLSRMSHEIRTPMNGVMGMITLAKKNLASGAEIQTYLDKAEESSKYLLALINDILDMSRIEAGKMVLAHNVLDLQGMRDRLDDMFRKTVEAKNVHYVVEMQDFDVRYVEADELRLMQVVVNFLSNAVKFTKEGEIRVTFRQMYRTEDKVHLMIRVHDTGKGMDPEFVNRIFKPFNQENESISREYGGTGLGMTITDQIVKMMGGEIVVDSMPGKGSDFSIYVELPIADAEEIVEAAATMVEETPVEPEEISLEGLHALLAEDNEINAEITCSLLEMEGMHVDHAVNGRVVVDKFAASEPGHYDVILMDIQMPEMNGFEATQAIRALDRSDAQSVKIFAISADAFVEDKRKAEQAGMNGHMAKPIDFEELKTKLGSELAEKEG